MNYRLDRWCSCCVCRGRGADLFAVLPFTALMLPVTTVQDDAKRYRSVAEADFVQDANISRLRLLI